ncbi:hypothetical protein [Pyrodictium abyssi]|uniref:hypothetical protein n=1 Tax=Pyrodictium abyssi TaxID=54256 RepID=UPI0030C6719F
MRGEPASRILLDPVVLAGLVLAAVMAILVPGPFGYLGLVLPLPVVLLRVLVPAARRAAGGLDIDLLFVMAHMYAVATGRPERRRLFELRPLVGDYGAYGRALSRIAVLAVEWGYGFVRATRLVAKQAPNRYLRDFLTRLSEVLRTGDDVVKFLRVELDTSVRQFTSSYMRSIELLRIFLGLYATLMSASMFVILTFTVLAVFMGGSTWSMAASMTALLAVITVFAVAARYIAPRDPVVYRGAASMNRSLARLRMLTRGGLVLSALGGAAVYLATGDPSYTILGLALPALIPGFYAIRVEGYIARLGSFYQVFVRSLGLTYSVIPSYAGALSSVLSAEYGPLTVYARRLYARVTNGVEPRTAFRYLSLETSNSDVVRGNNVFVDAVEAGGDPAETGLILSDLFIRLSDLRADRSRVARTFEAVVYLMQALVAAITSAIINILALFGHYYEALGSLSQSSAVGYLPFTITLPDLSTITWLVSAFLAMLALVNSVIIAYVRGSILESSLFHMAVLSVVTVAGVKAMEIISRLVIAPMMLPTAPLTGAP